MDHRIKSLLSRVAHAARSALDLVDPVPRARGTVDVCVYRDGVLIERIVEKNLIVDVAKLLQSRLIGGDVTNRSLTQIGFGTNATAPAAGNTALTGAFTKALDGHSYPDATSVSFSFSLGSTENNGMAISEFGLLAADGSLFARKTRTAPLNKASDITLTATWLIQF